MQRESLNSLWFAYINLAMPALSDISTGHDGRRAQFASSPKRGFPELVIQDFEW
jgi:hypothetical protein